MAKVFGGCRSTCKFSVEGGGGSVITNHMGIVTIYLRVLRAGRDETRSVCQ